MTRIAASKLELLSVSRRCLLPMQCRTFCRTSLLDGSGRHTIGILLEQALHIRRRIGRPQEGVPGSLGIPCRASILRSEVACLWTLAGAAYETRLEK